MKDFHLYCGEKCKICYSKDEYFMGCIYADIYVFGYVLILEYSSRRTYMDPKMQRYLSLLSWMLGLCEGSTYSDRGFEYGCVSINHRGHNHFRKRMVN